MTPFLKQVAQHYCAGDISELCFVFPNRRSLTFFRKYLSEEIAARAAVPVTAPCTVTISDFFFSAAGAAKADRVQMLLELHSCYKALRPGAEPLDDFIFWGDVLLGDFDDVDKYLVDPAHLFTNVADFKSIEDNYSYMSEAQVQAVERFLSHFREGGALKVDIDGGSGSKSRFLQIWDILLPLYRNFGAALDSLGVAYEGQAYRRLASRLDSEAVADILADRFPRCRKFVFTGLNALNECEKKVLRRMRDARLAEFCWDYSSPQIRDPHNKSSLFLSANVAEFPQAFKPDPDGLGVPSFSVLGVPSAVGGAKQLPEILSRVGARGLDTAVIIPDEGLLLPVLNSIPEHIRDLNVTMGYPMGGSEFWTLVSDVASLQLHLRQSDGRWMFYHKQVWAILSNSLLKATLSPRGEGIVKKVREERRYYIPQSDFEGEHLLELIFRPVVKKPAEADPGAVRAVADYLQEITRGVAAAVKDVEGMGIELDFAREYHLAVNRLRAYELPILPATYFRLLGRLLSGTAVPFKGEPLRGLQIMGPLETRALDFRNVVILSCNEGMFPRRSVSSSFIPAQLRKGFGLPTYEFQDAVWAYYFYRLVQRAENVWMVYDSGSGGLKSGEESRYIKQLELHFGLPVQRFVLDAPIRSAAASVAIEKTDEDVKALKEKTLSASSLQSYLCCPAQFYYKKVCGLKEKEEVSESLDAGMVGEVFHAAMEKLYTVGGKMTRTHLEGLIKDKSGVQDIVAALIKDKLKTFEVSGRNIIFQDIICRYVLKVMERDLALLQGRGTDSFRIFGLEEHHKSKIGEFSFTGVLDRLDSFEPGTVRVVDYKTGKVTDDDFIINEENAEKVVGALFGPDNSKRPKIALQLYLYDRFVQKDPRVTGLRVVNSIYQTSRLFTDEVPEVELCPTFCSLMEKKLSELLEEIADTSVPWRLTSEAKTCEWCDFKMICGR